MGKKDEGTAVAEKPKRTRKPVEPGSIDALYNEAKAADKAYSEQAERVAALKTKLAESESKLAELKQAKDAATAKIKERL